MRDLVSTIIPNFNGESYLEEAICSVLEQTYLEQEIIVVDDGSTDGSLDILRKYSNRINIIVQDNSGPSVARNKGILNSNGYYIAFLDSDDIWFQNKLKLQMDTIKRTNCDLVYCDFLEFRDSSQPKQGKSANESELKDWFMRNPTSTPFLPSSVVISKDLLAKSGLWSTTLKSPSEDFDLFRRCIANGVSSHLNQPLVLHRNHGDSTTASNHQRYFLDNNKAIRIFLAEERNSLDFSLRVKIWAKCHLSHLKHAIRQKNLRMSLRILQEYFRILL